MPSSETSYFVYYAVKPCDVSGTNVCVALLPRNDLPGELVNTFSIDLGPIELLCGTITVM